MQGKERWEAQIDAIVEKELAKSSFRSLGEISEGTKTVQKQFWENVRDLRTRTHGTNDLGYEAGRRVAPEIGCPLYLDTNSGRVKLGLVGYYVGGADEILENHSEYLDHAIRIYQNLGLLSSMHVLRKLESSTIIKNNICLFIIYS